MCVHVPWLFHPTAPRCTLCILLSIDRTFFTRALALPPAMIASSADASSVCSPSGLLACLLPCFLYELLQCPCPYTPLISQNRIHSLVADVLYCTVIPSIESLLSISFRNTTISILFPCPHTRFSLLRLALPPSVPHSFTLPFFFPFRDPFTLSTRPLLSSLVYSN